ncbi:MAG TPA: hypothetical protein VGN14_14355 [Candidatus Elarobacter sp.]
MSVTCPRCRLTSHSPVDEEVGWCTRCEAFTSKTLDEVAQIADAIAERGDEGLALAVRRRLAQARRDELADVLAANVGAEQALAAAGFTRTEPGYWSFKFGTGFELTFEPLTYGRFNVGLYLLGQLVGLEKVSVDGVRRGMG